MIVFYLWVVSKTLLCGCGPDVRRYDFNKVRSKYTIDKIAVLPPAVVESSGLASSTDGSAFWTHNDGGSPPFLFRVGLDGKLIEERNLEGIPHRDWEELAQDSSGRLFVGDIGNNSNARTDLSISILEAGWEAGKDEVLKKTITFRYGLQTGFPEEKKYRNFDSEAFFFHNDSLFLFSKNTGKKPRYTMLYKFPATAGDYTLYPSDSIKINETVTGADISPDGKQFVLLTYGKMFFFDIVSSNVDFSQPAFCLKKYLGQSEAILYQNKDTLLITNEKGKVFRVSKKRY